jgi:hypothetical protein
MTCQSGAITPKVGGALTPEIHTPFMTAQYSHEKTGEWRKVAAEKTLALIPLLNYLKQMRSGLINGYQFAFQMRRPSLRNAIKALADNENSYIAWQDKLTRLDTISELVRNNASNNQKLALREEQFDIAQDFLKTIGVTFDKIVVKGKDEIDPTKPLVPDWDFELMSAVLQRRAASLKRLPEKLVDKQFEHEHWIGANVSLEKCVCCIHCSHDYFCSLGRPIQSVWDDIEATTVKCDGYHKISTKIEAWEPTKN